METHIPYFAYFVGITLVIVTIHALIAMVRHSSPHRREGHTNFIFGLFIFAVLFFPVFHAAEQWGEEIIFSVYTVLGPIFLIAYHIYVLERSPRIPAIPKISVQG